MISQHRKFTAYRAAFGVGRYAVLLVFALFFLLPLLLIWFASLKTQLQIDIDPFGFPTSPQWNNFVQAWTVGHFNQYLFNTVLYCVCIVTGVVVLSSMAGYALAHIYIPGATIILMLFLLGIMVPFQSVMIPLYYLLRDIHILNTYFAFIIPGIALGLPFGIFLMRGFFRGLPKEIADAARIDGANEWIVFSRVILPLARPGVATLVVFQFMFTWNAFLMPLVFVQRDELRPVALGMMFYFGRYTSDQSMIAAGATIAMAPVVILYLVLQRQFIRGITAGAVRG
jgi:ABC-type glycerol-3-phosphate transport system permease component